MNVEMVPCSKCGKMRPTNAYCASPQCTDMKMELPGENWPPVMNQIMWFVIKDINPEPWKVGPVSVGRRGNALFGNVGPDKGLQAFQAAVKEEVSAKLVEGGITEDKFPVFAKGSPLTLELYLWRDMLEYSTHQARTARKHEADATNMLKAIEDSLQGVLYANDKDNHRVVSNIIDQRSGARSIIVIKIEPHIPVVNLPQVVWEKIEAAEELFNG